MPRNTRPANTAQHPGNPDKKRQRRTKAEMEEYRAQEAEKKKQKDLDQKAKIDRIASVEQRLTEELDVTPRPAIKQRLRRTTAFLELPLDSNPKDLITDESSLSAYNDDEFEPPTDRPGTEVETKTETETPPKKKKMAKESVRTAIKAALARDPEGGKKGSVPEEPTKGHPFADGKKLPHADNALDRRPKSVDGKAPEYVFCDELLLRTMLTLDPTTLFYLSLMETSNPKKGGLIDMWAAGVPTRLPLSKNSNKPASIRSIPSLTIGSTRSTSTLVLTNRVAITSAEPQVIDISDDEFGFPDEDETKGPERDAAVASPPKGKKRVTSSVSICSLHFQ